MHSPLQPGPVPGQTSLIPQFPTRAHSLSQPSSPGSDPQSASEMQLTLHPARSVQQLTRECDPAGITVNVNINYTGIS